MADNPDYRFWLGTHNVSHLERTDVPLFISFRRLRGRRKQIRQLGPVAIDSGGFSELSLNGGWSISPSDYIAELRRLRDEVGLSFEWAAQQDMMCEPHMIRRTGLSVAEHQAHTVENLITLRSLAPEIHFIPVLQGQSAADYLEHFEAFRNAGFDLTLEPLVGLGSVCRRQSDSEIKELIDALSGMGVNLHGFGVKTRGLADYAGRLVSSDSMAWSLNGRYSSDRCRSCLTRDDPPMSCANCLEYALAWRENLLEGV